MVGNAWWMFGFKWQRQKNIGTFFGRWIWTWNLHLYQFHGCHWHCHTCTKDCTKRQQKRYKDTFQIDWLIKNNGWDAKYNLVSTWECEESILKIIWFEKEFKSYPHFIVYDSEAILAPLNEYPTDTNTNKRCYSRYIWKRACIFSWWKSETFDWTIRWGINREARNNSCRGIEAASIFRCFQVRWKNIGGNGLIRFL